MVKGFVSTVMLRSPSVLRVVLERKLTSYLGHRRSLLRRRLLLLLAARALVLTAAGRLSLGGPGSSWFG